MLGVGAFFILGTKLKKALSNVREIDWARLAAFIDGEGTVRVYKAPTGRWGLRVVISNTDIRLISWLEETFGGYVYNVKPSTGNTKPSFQWIFASRIDLILAPCLPYFIIKRDQAEIALAFCRTNVISRIRSKKEEVSKTREELKSKLLVIQKRGAA